MSELENDEHPPFSENERHACSSSPLTLKPSETEVTLEVDAEKPSVSLKDDRSGAVESSSSQKEEEIGEHPQFSSFSENERHACSSSPLTLKPSETDVALEVDDAEKPSETDFKVSLKDDRSGAVESSSSQKEEAKVEMNFEDLKQDNPVRSKDLSDGTLCEKSSKKVLSCPEDGEVVEVDETNADLEEGEIQESPSKKSVETYNCRYYQMGFCVYGKDCRFFHVSDKGLYSMFDLSVSVQKNIHHPTQFTRNQKDISVPPDFEVEKTFQPDFEVKKTSKISRKSDSEWDQALKEAMDLIKSKKKAASGRDNLRMTIDRCDCSDEKLSSKEFPPKNSFRRAPVNKTHSSSLSRRKTAYEISPARPKSSSRGRIDTRCSFINRSRTPRNMRWSPKTVSCSSDSRSRSRSSSSCSCTGSTPKRGSRILSSTVAKSYRRKRASSSSKSSSTGYASKTGSRRFKRRRREYGSHFKSRKTSDCRSPVKILLPKRLEGEWCRLSMRAIPRPVIPPKSQMASKSTSSCTRPCDKSRSDAYPLSNLSNRKDDCIEDHSAVYCSDRHVRDMSISPLSSPSRTSNRIEVENYSASKSKDEDLGKNRIRTGSPNDQPLILPAPQENISEPTPETIVKKNSPLVMHLVKFRRNFKKDDSMEGVKNMTKAQMKTTASELVDKPSNHTEMNKVHQKTDTIQSKLSKKEILLKRLREINAAIERKNLTEKNERK